MLKWLNCDRKSELAGIIVKDFLKSNTIVEVIVQTPDNV